MIDIFHISRICCKVTNYLRYYRICAAVFISRGWFLRRRGVSLTDFADDYLTQISRISQIFLSHRFRGFFGRGGVSLTDLTDFTDFFISQIADFAHGFCGWFFLSLTDLTDFTDFFISQILTCPGYSLRNRN